MKTFLKSMAGRIFLILLAGILASVALTWWLASTERQRTISQFRETRALEQAEQFILTLDAIPGPGRDAFLATARRFGLKGEALRSAQQDGQDAATDSGFTKTLRERLDSNFRLESLPKAQSECLAVLNRRNETRIAMIRDACETMRVTLHDGSQVRLVVLPPRMPPPPPQESLLALGLFLASIGVLAFVVARMTVRPLKQLARAAEDLGGNIDHPPLPQRGASEIRQASAAFNAMQARLRAHVRERTDMLAAITHDLQTPLTRLRLRLEKVDDHALRDKLIHDLSHTQTIVREGLELARSMDVTEPLQPLDLDSLLDSVCADATDAGQSVTLAVKPGLTIMARPTALRRCLTNLIDNAVKYGRFAEVSTRDGLDAQGRKTVIISVRDGGPGIAPDQLQKVFEPFFRSEPSRSRETGGTGLGLTIARNIARQHGGGIELVNLAAGGFEARLILPAGSQGILAGATGQPHA
jgi:signal transduction histidine kinase